MPCAWMGKAALPFLPGLYTGVNKNCPTYNHRSLPRGPDPKPWAMIHLHFRIRMPGDCSPVSHILANQEKSAPSSGQTQPHTKTWQLKNRLVSASTCSSAGQLCAVRWGIPIYQSVVDNCLTAAYQFDCPPCTLGGEDVDS